MAEEAGHFTLDDVLGAICDKLERRHPHLFGGAAETPGWEAIKAAERQRKPDVAPAPKHDEIEILLGHRRERTSGPRAHKHGSNVRPRRTSSSPRRYFPVRNPPASGE